MTRAVEGVRSTVITVETGAFTFPDRSKALNYKV
jgi:hypothetical protein